MSIPNIFFDHAKKLVPFNGLALEPDARWHLTQALGIMMSEVSEETIAAGWLIDLENRLPPACRIAASGENTGWVMSMEQARTMCAIADALGHWVNHCWWDSDDPGECYVPYRPQG